MTALPINAEASGSITPGASAINGFITITITNTVVVMLAQLADEVQVNEPGTAEVISAFAETFAGQALDLIRAWPA